MIAKAKAISHGINDIRYITGESAKKTPRENLSDIGQYTPFPSGRYGYMELHATDLITLQTYQELCHQNRAKSSVEHTRFFDIEDWQKLWQDFVAEFDKQVFTGKDGKVRSSQTNLANSKYSVWLHKESAGEVPHLHAAVCRLMKTVTSTTTTTFIFVRSVLPSE